MYSSTSRCPSAPAHWSVFCLAATSRREISAGATAQPSRSPGKNVFDVVPACTTTSGARLHRVGGEASSSKGSSRYATSSTIGNARRLASASSGPASPRVGAYWKADTSPPDANSSSSAAARSRGNVSGSGKPPANEISPGMPRNASTCAIPSPTSARVLAANSDSQRGVVTAMPATLGNRAGLRSAPVPIPVFSRAHVEAAVSPVRALEAVRDAFVAYASGDWTMPPKVYVPAYPAGDFRAMPAPGGGHALLKWVTSFPGNPARGLPTVTGLVLLSDASDGSLRAALDAGAVTALRTGAAAIVAAE